MISEHNPVIRDLHTYGPTNCAKHRNIVKWLIGITSVLVVSIGIYCGVVKSDLC